MAFGDVDAEDAWDEDDPRPEKLGILVRLLVSIAMEQAKEHLHERLVARLAFGEMKVAELIAGHSDDERPILEALNLGFFYLSVAEGH